MEPVEAPVNAPRKIKINYTVMTSVIFKQNGWLQFNGSQERMYFGDCHFEVGDQVKITFERIINEPT